MYICVYTCIYVGYIADKYLKCAHACVCVKEGR